MGLSDFERGLAEEKSRESKHRSHRENDEDREHRHRHRHSNRSHKHRDEKHDQDEDRRHRHKRHRDRREDDDEGDGGKRHRRKRQKSDSPKAEKPAQAEEKETEVKVFDTDGEEEDEEWVEKEAATAPPEEDILDQRDGNLRAEKVQRDAWMQEPSALDEVEVVRSRKPKAPPSQFVGAKEGHEFKVHESEINKHLKDLERDFDSDGDDEGGADGAVVDEPAQHNVDYVFGDDGSGWRMTKLKAVYRKADESGRSVDDVALERYGDLRDFDDAREEERELDRRKMYGREYVGLEKPSGALFQERKMRAGLRRESSNHPPEEAAPTLPQGEAVPDPSAPPPSTTAPLDSTALNKLKAQMMKAKLRNAPNAAQLEQEYNLASRTSMANSTQSDIIVLNNMENRALASGRTGEVKAAGTGKRARERGLVVENEDMSIEDMVKQEKRTAHGTAAGEGRQMAERIAKDGKFVNDLDYIDDNAENLSKKVVKSDSQLKNTAIDDFTRIQRVLETCPLCYHDEKSDPRPVAPVVSLATRTYLTLPTEPEIAKGGGVIVPIQHRRNLLECDEDEWEELRNFMKSLLRHYDSQGKGVIFYENAAHPHKHPHAALNAVPLPHHLAETAPAYFKEAILSSDEQWSQQKPIIDTLSLSQRAGYGKRAFQKGMVKEMPYFHVWFGLDGGLGHVVEDERRWPKGDLFAREVLGGMLDRGPEIVKRQGRWERGDRRVEGFRKKWGEWDWTKALMEAE